MQKFDLCTSPLQGRWLLEASAGTGKTYSLEHIVVRLLVERGVPVNRVLLVTFTNAATNEISERVRALLRRMLARAQGTLPVLSDALEEKLIARWGLESDALACLFSKALEDFEDASILTIHKFCQKMLSEFSFTRAGDYGVRFDEGDALFGQVVEEFIRTYSCRLAPEDVLALARWQKPLVKILEDLALNKVVVDELRVDESLSEETSGALIDAFKEFLEKAPERLEALQKQARTMSFNGLLVETYRLVHAMPALAACIRRRYDAVLIDEFQDTDSIQYGIFKTVFFPDEKAPEFGTTDKGAGVEAIFFVGDPKQAIYSFRMAELETYIKARREIEALPAGAGGVLSLEENFRSARPLVEFVNLFFKDKEVDGKSGQSAFLTPDIHLDPVKAAGSALPLVRVKGNALEPVPAVSLWLNEERFDTKQGCAGEEELNADAVRDKEAQWIAEDVAGLLDGTVYLKKKTVVDGRVSRSRPLRAGDIVILMASRSNAQKYIDALAKKGVRCVLDAKDDVLATDEGLEIFALLRAMDAPGSRSILNAARATRLFGRTLAEIRGGDDLGVADRQLFELASSRWRVSGPAGAVGLIMAARETTRRLLKVRQGRGVLENYSHVLEVLQERFASLRTLSAVLQWMHAEMARVGSSDREGVPEERKVRTIAGDDVVRILTMHSSKGLEFPVVYLADPMSVKERSRFEAYFQKGEDTDPEDGRRRVYAVFSPLGLGDAYKERAKTRDREERVRLAYVAMTRASSRLVLPLFYSTNRQANQSLAHAYARALFALCDAAAPKRDDFCPRLRTKCFELQQRLYETCKDFAPDPADFGENLVLSELFKSPESLVEIRTQPPEKVLKARATADRGDPAQVAALAPVTLGTSFVRTSFTAIARGLVHPQGKSDDDYEPGPDALDRMEEAADAAPESRLASLEAADGEPVPAPAEADNLAAAPFLRGAGVGDWLHRQLQAAFEARSVKKRRESLLSAAERLSNAYFMTGRADNEREAAARLVRARFEALSEAVLFCEQDCTIAVPDIEPGSVVPEMGFLLNAPAHGVVVERLIEELNRAGFSFQSDEGSARKPLSGFVTGSIDLMFAAGGKYWIIDWKSNFLGDGLPASYTQQAMEQEILAKNYALQYTIYLVALKRHLLATTSLTPQTVWDAIGGAAYVFLRGIEAGATLNAQGRRNGVFVTRPRQAVDALDALLSRAPDGDGSTEACEAEGRK